MIAGCIEGATHKLMPTSDDCMPLAIRRTAFTDGTSIMVSAWYPTPKEIEAMSRGEPVYVTVFGDGHPPMYVGVKP